MEHYKIHKYGIFTSILVALGPVLWLFINIYDKNYESLPLNIALAVLGVFIVLFNIKQYLKIYIKRRNIIIEILSHIISFLFYVSLIIVVLIIFMLFCMMITVVQEKLFTNGNYIIFMTKSPYSYLVFVIEALIITNIIEIIFNKSNKLMKYIAPLIAVLLFIIITCTAVITEDGIYDYSFYNLKGNKYSFNQVVCINTGFKDSGRNKGEFYYNIELDNGKKLDLSYPSMTQPSSKYDDSTWQEYVDIDKLIMKNGVKKISSEAGRKHATMDKIYVDRLLWVIRNK